jgi:hypothetical protein
MKKNLMAVLWAVFLVIPSNGFSWQNQEHQHRGTSLKQYEEREKRYEDRWYWQMPQRVMEELGIGQGMNVCQPSNATDAKDDHQIKRRKRP